MFLPWLVALLTPTVLSASPQHPGCLHYGPDTVSVAGVLERRTYPGRPNYQSIRAGDEPETGFYLLVSAPLCTIPDTTVPDAPALRGVRLVQLVLDSAGYAALRPRLGHRVVLCGTLFATFTGHHYAPLLLEWSPRAQARTGAPTRRTSSPAPAAQPPAADSGTLRD